jgi:cytochrome c oxidase cbb3-type subunit III
MSQNDQVQVPVRPFEADGIKELDNNLPSWWVGLFAFTTIFGALYLLYVHGLGGPKIADEFKNDMASMPQPGSAPNGSGDSKDLNAMLASQDSIASGKAAYTANCAPCHGPSGEGNIGPNLTDKFWLHGGSSDKIYLSIANGVVEKGMPAWGPVLGDNKVKELTAFISSIKGTNVAGKAPQGTEEP